MSTFAVILPAAGSSSRFRDKHYKKPFIQLAGKAVWQHAAERFLARNDVKQVLLVVAEEDRHDISEKYGANLALMGVELVTGGQERGDSVRNALARVSPEHEFVAIHDAARPCLTDDWIAQVFAAARNSGAALLAVPVASTLKRVAPDHKVQETVSRANLWEAQTPQVFRRSLLLDAYARHGGGSATDDAQLVERLGHVVTVVPGSALNLKITTKDDLRLAEAVLKVLPKPKGLGALHPFQDDDLWR